MRILYWEKRNWGWFFTLIQTNFFWIKILWVEKGHRTSLQTHKLRSELHIGKIIQFIAKNEAHRLTHGFWIEIVWGEPKEEDIFRIEDDYGREMPL